MSVVVGRQRTLMRWDQRLPDGGDVGLHAFVGNQLELADAADLKLRCRAKRCATLLAPGEQTLATDPKYLIKGR